MNEHPSQTTFRVGDRVRVTFVEDAESCVKKYEGTQGVVESVRSVPGDDSFTVCWLSGVGPGFYADELEAVR